MKASLYKLEALLEKGGIKKDVTLLVLGGIALLLSLVDRVFPLLPPPFDFAWITIALCGVPIILEAVIGLVCRHDIKADVLVSIALIAAVMIGEFFSAGEVAFIMQLGGLLEDVTVSRARAGIEKLVELKPIYARVLRGGDQTFIRTEEVRAGDLIRVLPGERIPVDGVIRKGTTTIDQAVMTGEPMPVDKTVGDEVLSGTVNRFGSFDMEATKVGEDSSIQRMIRLVQSADAGKAKVVRLADRWATWIVVGALAAAALAFLFTGEINRSVTVLVVFCPCALVLATPTAVMAATGNAAKRGFLVREGDALERLAKVRMITFDKTGTLTFGTPEVVRVRALPGYREEEILRLAASVEARSEHPLARAIVKDYRRRYGREAEPADDFTMIPGRGARAVAAGRSVLAGNDKYLEENGIPTTDLSAGEQDIAECGVTRVYVAVGDEAAGMIELADTLRPEAEGMIRELRAQGAEPVLLTGDHAGAAEAIAGRLGIPETEADCLPEEKLERIGRYQQEGRAVCMIGDGINDAPALKKADVGIAMGGAGSEIAADAADIVLVDDEIRGLPHLLALSRRMMTTIRIDLAFSLALNFLAMALAVTGVLGPVVGALMHNAGSVLVIVNSVLLLRWGRRLDKGGPKR